MGEQVEGETFVLSEGIERKKGAEDLCGGKRGNGREMDKRVGLFGRSAVGIIGITVEWTNVARSELGRGTSGKRRV